MPELPEVETSRTDVEHEFLGRRIVQVTVLKAQKLRKQTAEELKRRVERQLIQSVERLGKFLLIELEGGDTLVIHRGMSGNLLLELTSVNSLNHVHLVLEFDDGRKMYLNDPRGFGEVRVVSQVERTSRFSDLGIDALDKEFTPEYLATKLAKHGAPIKSLLLSQSIVAGLGNIYVDEVLWASQIHPKRPGSGLSYPQIERLHQEISVLLRRAIAGRGTTFSDALTLYGQPGEFGPELQIFHKSNVPCPRCGDLIQHTKIAQRGTSFCPTCQPFELLS